MGQADERVLTDKSALRDAATVIVLRDAQTRPRVLMGQRRRSPLAIAGQAGRSGGPGWNSGRREASS